jgi:hypothetical protein
MRVGSFEGAKLSVSCIRNALTMGERCGAIELLRGKFYGKWEDVPKQDMSTDTGDLDHEISASTRALEAI